LNNSLEIYDQKIAIIFKPHPATPILPQEYPKLNFSVRTESFFELSKCADFALTSLTTAALEVLSLGLHVITFIYPNTLNMSPLRGIKDVSSVSTPEELMRVIGAQLLPNPPNIFADRFFNLDEDLPKWLEILNFSEESS
jgi:surface carbohydrate biosynthesis protein (TIGR04326 family)